jgi:hypothetical protein
MDVKSRNTWNGTIGTSNNVSRVPVRKVTPNTGSGRVIEGIVLAEHELPHSGTNGAAPSVTPIR